MITTNFWHSLCSANCNIHYTVLYIPLSLKITYFVFVDYTWIAVVCDVAWFISCQVLTTGCLMVLTATTIVTGLIFLHCCPIMNHEYLQTYGMFAAGSMMFLVSKYSQLLSYSIVCSKCFFLCFSVTSVHSLLELVAVRSVIVINDVSCM